MFRYLLSRIRILIEKFIACFILVDKRKTVLIDGTPYSGSNAQALYNYLLKMGLKKVRIINYSDALLKNIRSIKDFSRYFKNFITVNSAGIVLTTHGYEKLKKNQAFIELWHGIPLKGMMLMDNTIDRHQLKKEVNKHQKYNYIVSSSYFVNTLMNSCMGADVSKYAVTGYPRNDLLFDRESHSKLLEILKIEKSDKRKVLFYIPTFKMGYNSRVEGTGKKKNIFGFYDALDYKNLNEFLTCNNLMLVIKLHPFEEKLFKNIIEEKCGENIYLLTSDMLRNNKTDLYNVLNSSDLLITDYSSVYIDYLLTGKPMIFINNDIDIYRGTRGLLLEPYDDWTPGPKVQNQAGLEKEIINSIENDLYYKEERDRAINVFHYYNDNKSCERVLNIIKNIQNHIGVKNE